MWPSNWQKRLACIAVCIVVWECIYMRTSADLSLNLTSSCLSLYTTQWHVFIFQSVLVYLQQLERALFFFLAKSIWASNIQRLKEHKDLVPPVIPDWFDVINSRISSDLVCCLCGFGENTEGLLRFQELINKLQEVASTIYLLFIYLISDCFLWFSSCVISQQKLWSGKCIGNM